MNLEKRKKELMQVALEENFHGADIYRLIKDESLDHIIPMITNEITKTKYRSVVEKGYLTGDEQFVQLLTEFIHYFNSKLPPIIYDISQISLLLENQVPEWMLCKKYWGDNENIDYFILNFNKTIVNHFYENILFVYDNFSEIFEKEDITKEMSLDNTTDVDIIFNFLKKLVWSNPNEFGIYFLFESSGQVLKEYTEINPEPEKMRKAVTEHIIIHWENLIDKFIERKNVVEEFLKFK